jgi:serine/threonine protein kinase
VKLLQDDHLIKVVKAYKHGDRYNFIFPLAKTNLRHYIREPHTYTQAQPPIIAHPLWQEALGLARGLHRVLVYEAPNDTRSRPMYGYHLDLKPANILVDPSGRLIITDFGLSEFLRPADVTSSRVRGRGGTEAYAPPEIDYEEIILNRKYDIWSLGCIFLEIAAFIVRGEAGVRDLDRARTLTTPGTFNTDDRFFHHNPSGHNYELKPSIIRQIKFLIMAVSVGVERTFVESFLLIVVQMLRPDPISRISSSDVCIAISELLNRSQSSYHHFGHLSVTENQLRDGREEAEAPIATFGSELLLEFQPIRFVTDRYPESGNLHLSQEQDVLCLHSQDSAGSRLVIQGDRSAMRLVPEYAFCGPGMTKFEDATLKILSKSEKDFKSICSFDLNKNIRAVTMLQEVLTGQAVVISGKIKSVKLAPKQKSGMSKRLSRNKHHSDAIGTLGRVSSVQLWRNTQHRDIATMAKIEKWPRRRSSGSAPQQPYYRRVVVYFENSMLIMRLAKNLRLAGNSGQDDSPASATFIPTNKKVDKYFSVSLIGQTFLPLVNGELEAMEEVCRVECTSLSLEFHSIEEAKAFRNKYKSVKGKWAEDYDRLEVLQQRIGFDY